MATHRDLTANGRVANVVDADGNSQRLAASPAKFDDDPAALGRAPHFTERTDDVPRDLGLDDERLIELKTAGAIT
jgi:crotonobetainyl-CoA:carnitine CoA-transferase CaiB-like acyl-CoA transferase